MAARRRGRTPAEEWSCPLCTLLNHWRDRRCAACDQERAPQPSDGDDEGADEEESAAPPQQQQGQHVHADATVPVRGSTLAPTLALRGVFFSSASTARTPAQSTSAGSANNWRHEPRLKVNRCKRPLPQPYKVSVAPTSVTIPSSSSLGDSQSQAPSFSLLGAFSGALATAAADDATGMHQPAPASPPALHQYVQPASAVPVAAEPEEDSAMLDEDESQPCFQLLGPNTAMFPVGDAGVTATPVDDSVHHTGNSSSSFTSHNVADRYDDSTAAEYAPPSFRVIDMSSTPPAPVPPRNRPPPPAADYQRVREPAVPAAVLQQGFVAANRDPLALDEQVVEAKLAQAGLNLSDSDEDSDGFSRPKNKLRRNRVASPEPAASDEEKAPAENGGGTWECPICTNFNSCALARCELCDTKRESDGEDDSVEVSSSLKQYIDLANSQEEEAKAAAGGASPNYYGFDPRDFENPYEQVPPGSPAYNDYGGGADMGGAGYDDYVEDISDHEAPVAYGYQPHVRTELKEFEHFVCVEDLAMDYGCRIDYRQMFGESKRGKVYADRIQTRQRASQKRKRTLGANGGFPPSGKRGGSDAGGGKAKSLQGRQKAAATRKASGKARAAKKRKSAAGGRSTAAAAAAASGGRGKGRRASAPPTATYNGINHYDTSGADFGDGVSTMAWEGVGSAGYF